MSCYGKENVSRRSIPLFFVQLLSKDVSNKDNLSSTISISCIYNVATFVEKYY